MLRALAELHHVMPGVRLVPHVVLSEDARSDAYLMSGYDFRLYFVEYVKFLMVNLRFFLVPAQALSSNGVSKVAGERHSAGRADVAQGFALWEMSVS